MEKCWQHVAKRIHTVMYAPRLHAMMDAHNGIDVIFNNDFPSESIKWMPFLEEDQLMSQSAIHPDDKLHKECAQMKAPATLSPMMSPSREMPVMAEAKTVSTFAHQPHPVSEMYSNSGYCCAYCNTIGYGRRYRCVECKVDMHLVCTENPTRLSTFMHPKHELALKTKPHSKKCDLCGHHTTGTSYR
ncbi:hypothetical protein Ancab_017082 [Ancistrocladus abbreviatus]